MKKTLLLLSLTLLMHYSNAQNVETYAGKVNDDPINNYESTSGIDLDNTFFSNPVGLCFDTAGRMYISENSKIRIVTNDKLYIRSGSLQQPTFSEGYRNATGTQATYRNPSGMASDANGNIYIADAGNHCIRKLDEYINLGNGQVASTFAGAAPTPGLPGQGTSGSLDGTGTSARFNQPRDVTIDGDGNLYVTDERNYTIRKITPAGVVTTLAGAAGAEGTDDGMGANAKFGRPWGIAMYKANTIVVSDPWNGNIREINIFSGETKTLAGPTSGAGVFNIVDGTLEEARFRAPKGIAVIDDIIYVADQNVIRAINVTNNSVSTFAGNVNQFAVTDGAGANASFTELADLASDGAGNLYVTENSLAVASHVIRKITINELAPLANFEASKRSLRVAESVTLTDISEGEESTSRNWVISPTSYSITEGSLTSEVLKLSFNSAGFYEVRLAIGNQYGTDTKIASNFFAVSTTGSVTQYNDNPLLTVYPNPASDQVILSLDPLLDRDKSTLSLYTVHGTKLMQVDATDSIDVSMLGNGTYYLTYSSDEYKIVKKIMVAHK